MGYKHDGSPSRPPGGLMQWRPWELRSLATLTVVLGALGLGSRVMARRGGRPGPPKQLNLYSFSHVRGMYLSVPASMTGGHVT